MALFGSRDTCYLLCVEDCWVVQVVVVNVMVAVPSSLVSGNESVKIDTERNDGMRWQSASSHLG